MSEIKVVTKGNVSPQGKSRVYFSCHPDDFKLYFEDIKKEIFETQDCAIFYESDLQDMGNYAGAAEQSEDIEQSEDALGELATSLSEMSLFIVIVSTKFLYHECRALFFEYGFAMEHNIPIIPITVKPGLGKCFTERLNRIKPGYGDLQYLDRTSRDLTEIPYKEKLKNRLEMVIVGDELAGRVRDAFDAYIFLSYRKKDRAYAKKLMRIIHSIPHCRDIAIWYDEFLVPGENWSKAIADALRDSKLMALAVTDKLFETGNYVLEHEYKDAVEAGREVIPAEMEKVDYGTLTSFFDGISMPIDGYDSKALSEALHNSKGLSEILKSIAVKENDNDSEHNFLIGLAYLNGIDVERDNDRAETLITSAAEAHLPEAMKKLVNMYNTGDGVERNYQTAVEWQEKYVQVLEEKAENNKLYLYDVMVELRNLGDMLYKLENCEDSNKCYQKSLEISKEIAEETGTMESYREMSTNYVRLGNNSHILERKSVEAKECYIKGLKISEEIATETGTVESHLDLSKIYVYLGDIAFREGKLDEAKDYYIKGLKISEEIAAETRTVESRWVLSMIYCGLGHISESERKMSEAKEYFIKQLKIIEELVETGNVEFRLAMSMCYQNLEIISWREGKMSEARKFDIKCLEIMGEIAKETETETI